MAHVLPVTAIEHSAPIALFIQLEPDDPALHLPFGKLTAPASSPCDATLAKVMPGTNQSNLDPQRDDDDAQCDLQQIASDVDAMQAPYLGVAHVVRAPVDQI